MKPEIHACEDGVIAGCGAQGYQLALSRIARLIDASMSIAG